MSFKTFTKLYETCVWPVMDYCSSIWGHNNYKKSDKIHNRALRYFLGLHRNAPILGFQADMGWLTPKYKYFLSSIRLWNRIVNSEHGSLTRNIFEWNVQNLHKNSWESNMLIFFESLNRVDIFIEAKELNTNNLFEQLMDIQHDEWSQQVACKTKLRTFTLFKDNFETELFIKQRIPKFQRSIFAQLRVGILPLEIEVGRYYRIKVENRICKLCKEDIEDEIHFMCKCKCLKEIRDKYFLLFNVPQETCNEQFIFIMTNASKLTVKFVNDMWQKRSFLLNI